MAIVVVFVAVMFLVFGIVGQATERALEFCDFDRENGPAWMQEASEIGLGWTWSPFGFECVFMDHDPETGEQHVMGRRAVGLCREGV